MCTPLLLLVLGAALELFGIALVAFDVFDAWREREQLSRQNQLVQVGSAKATLGVGRPTVIGANPPPTPPLDERVQKLESEVESLSQQLESHHRESKQDHREMLETVAGWVAEARREVFDLREELRPMIGRAAAGNIRRRGLGVALIGAGLILQTIANIAAL